MAGADSIEVRYSSSRRDVWLWYRKAWISRLWVFHLVVSLSVTAAILWVESGSHPVGPAQIAGAIGVALLLIAAMATYPQVVFKAQERWLQIRPDGMATRIKSMSRQYSWGEVAKLTAVGDSINIGLRSGNAFIIPRRAFASDADRTAFLDAARRWSGLPR